MRESLQSRPDIADEARLEEIELEVSFRASGTLRGTRKKAKDSALLKSRTRVPSNV